MTDHLEEAKQQKENAMTTTDPDTTRGLYGKYRVEKVNGKPIGQCFVLEESDPHAVAALRAYAESCANDGFVPLATDLMLMADSWNCRLAVTDHLEEARRLLNSPPSSEAVLAPTNADESGETSAGASGVTPVLARSGMSARPIPPPLAMSPTRRSSARLRR